MKKLVYILFILVYLLPTFGVAVAYHFCGETLVSTFVVVSHEAKEPVDCCGEEPEEDACCTNQFVFHKLDDLHFATEKTTVDDSSLEYVLIPFETIYQTEILEAFAAQNSASHSPPGEPTYIINRTLLI